MISEESLRPGPGPHTVQVLYEHAVILNPRALEAALSRRRTGVTITSPDHNGAVIIRHPERVELREDDEPIRGANGEILVLRENPLPASIDCAPATKVSLSAAELAQTWEWPGGRGAAKATLTRCSHAVVLMELASLLLPVPARVDVLVDTVAAIVEAYPPLAIRWPRIERIDEPQAFLEAAADPVRRLRTMVNVRLFNVAGAGPREMVMDTLGLSLLGLLGDVQVHFSGLDPGRIAEYLQDVTGYLLGRAAADDGPILAEGDVLPAPAPDPSGWRVRHEMALMKPRRGVFDLDTGTRSP